MNITHPEALRLQKIFDEQYPLPKLVEALRGRNGGLRPSKPKTHPGVVQYIWRMCRFHGGDDMTMPVTAYWDLMDWTEQYGVKMSHCAGDMEKQIVEMAECSVDDVLKALGKNPNKAAIRWGRAMGYL